MIDTAIRDLTPLIGTRAACVATGRPSASYYRGRTKAAPPQNKSPPAAAPAAAPSLAPASDSAQPRALTCAEREQVLAVLNSERFVDMAPASVYATLLDEGSYLCSESTMYRLLRERGLTGERRRQRQASGDGEAGTDCSPTEFGVVVGYRAPRGARNRVEVRDHHRWIVAAIR